MSLFQALILGLFYWLGNSYCFSYRYASYMPIAVGFLTGIVLGDVQTGAVVGATIGLVYIGSFFVGGSVPADTTMAAIIGTSTAIIGGLDVEAALAVAVPVGLIGNILHYSRMAYFSVFVNMSDKLVAQGKEDKLWITNVFLPQLSYCILCTIPVTLACYFGVSYIASLVAMLSGKFMTIVSVMAGMLPAIGIALTLSMIYKGEAKPFFFIGFLLVGIMGFTMVESCVVGVIGAVIYISLKNSNKSKEGAQI